MLLRRPHHVATRRPRRNFRRGTATVELAVGLMPLLILLIGTVDVCQLMFLRQEATLVAFETARLRARPNVTTVRAIDRGQTLIRDRGLSGGEVIFRFPNGEAGDDNGMVLVESTVTIPASRNMMFGFFVRTQVISITRSAIGEIVNHTN